MISLSSPYPPNLNCQAQTPPISFVLRSQLPTLPSTSPVRAAAPALKLERTARSRRVRQGKSAGTSRGRQKRRRRIQSQGCVSPRSAGSSSAPAAEVARFAMENMWQGLDSVSRPMGEVNYTPYIPLVDDSVAFEQPVNNYPEGSHNLHNAVPPEVQKKGKRLKNFTTIEDERLCSAYLNVSKDPIVGVNQPLGAHWDRIKAYVDEHKKTAHPRSKSSLAHRWGDIQKDTSRFCGFFAKIERKHQSGKSEDDKVKDALMMYEGIVGSQFKFIHCWLILHNEMKWNSWLASMSTSTGAEDVQPGQPTTDGTLPAKIERLIGRDKAKKQRSNTSSSSSACLEVLQKMSMDRVAYEERVEAATKDEARDIASCSDRKLALQEQQLQMQVTQVRLQQEMQEMLQLQKEQEDRVMNMDVKKMAPWVRDYYINKQKKIAAMSLRGEGSSGN